MTAAIRKKRLERSAPYRRKWRADIAVLAANEGARMACVHVSKSLQAAGVPFDDNLYHMTWFFTREEVRRELEDAARIRGRFHDDPCEAEAIDRHLLNGEVRPVIGDPRYEMDADEWRHTIWSGADGLHDSAEGARATVTARNNTNTTVMQ